jgi:hypothetical protein
LSKFSADPDCVLRISLEPAGRTILLSDGVAIPAGDPVVAIHFWNEHLPVLPPEGLTAAWTGVMKRRIRHSFELLADYIETEPRFADVAAIHGAPAFPQRFGPVALARTLHHFGFDVMPPEHDLSLHARLDSLLILGMNWAFNPVELRRHGRSYGRIHIWMSRRKLIERHGTRRPIGAMSPALSEPS